MEWKTKVTDLLGCRYPILEGAYGGIGKWEFAKACADAGAYGLITASVYRTPDKLREAIRKCRDATDGIFGVNLSFGICPRIEEMLEVCIEERVPVETAAYKPDSLAPRIKEAGLTWIHKSARVKDAVHAEKLGADAVIVVGLEGVGFKSPEQLPTLITTIQAKRELKVPFIAAGGIGDARGFMGALGMGADAIMMGTAFMATDECPLGTKAKDKMVRSTPYNLQLRNQVLSPPDPIGYKEIMEKRDTMPFDKWLRALERLNLHDPAWRQDSDPAGEYTFDEEWGQERPSRLVSLAVGVIDKVVPVKDLVDEMVQGAEDLVDGWEFLKTR
ncbi:NAD(P)H-dependent flavin oxidoreductase [Thermodesulfobacteriota bacterium]